MSFVINKKSTHGKFGMSFVINKKSTKGKSAIKAAFQGRNVSMSKSKKYAPVFLMGPMSDSGY